MPPRTRRIAAILPQELEYSGRLLQGAFAYAKEHRHIRLVDLPYHVDAPRSLRFGRSLGFDAALLWANTRVPQVDRLLSTRIPLISASGDLPVAKIPCIAFSGKAVEEAAIEHLAQLRPAVLVHLEFRSVGRPHLETRARRFLDGAARRGIPAKSLEIFHPGDPKDTWLARRMHLTGKAATRLEGILRKLPRPAAFWCGEDTLALRVCEAAGSLGLRIPEDIAVLGLGNLAATESSVPPVSSIPQPGETIGYHAFSILDRRLSGETGFPQRLLVPPPPVVARESTVGVPERDSVARALALIAERACLGLTVAELAEAVGLSPQTLTDRFLKRTGHPPGEEIRRVKLATAKRHLCDTRLGIAEIANLCGYNQHSKFSNFFKRETGISPRDYRRQHGLRR